MRKPPFNCRVCDKDLMASKCYYKRNAICEEHSQAKSVVFEGKTMRWCQQCCKFQGIADFDKSYRTCRKRLQLHNSRRRQLRDEPPIKPLLASRPKNGRRRVSVTVEASDETDDDDFSTGSKEDDVSPNAAGSAAVDAPSTHYPNQYQQQQYQQQAGFSPITAPKYSGHQQHSISPTSMLECISVLNKSGSCIFGEQALECDSAGVLDKAGQNLSELVNDLGLFANDFLQPSEPSSGPYQHYMTNGNSTDDVNTAQQVQYDTNGQSTSPRVANKYPPPINTMFAGPQQQPQQQHHYQNGHLSPHGINNNIAFVMPQQSNNKYNIIPLPHGMNGIMPHMSIANVKYQLALVPIDGQGPDMQQRQQQPQMSFFNNTGSMVGFPPQKNQNGMAQNHYQHPAPNTADWAALINEALAAHQMQQQASF